MSETALYSHEKTGSTPHKHEKTELTPPLILNLFLGNKKIEDINSSLKINGIRLDYRILPDDNTNLIVDYLIYKGDINDRLNPSCSSLGTDVLNNIPSTNSDLNGTTSRDYPSLSEAGNCLNTMLSVRGTEYSVGAKYHYNYNIERGSDLIFFGGAGFVHVAINTLNNQSLNNNKNSGVGVYFEVGIEYFYKNHFNVGYYIRQSSVSFKTGGDPNLRGSGEINWGGTHSGFIFGYTF